ncbi:MAG: hypothetical protein AAF456_01710 [Planctomycetota bacterium]
MAENTTTTEHESGDDGHGKPRYDDINTPVVVLVGVLSTIVTIAIIAAVQGLCYQWESSELNEKSVVNWPAAQQVAEQKAMLDGGEDTISIEDAMEKVVAAYGAGTENAGTENNEEN